MLTVVFDFSVINLDGLPVTGIKDAIEEVRQHYKVVVVSTSGIDDIKAWLKEHDIVVDDVTSERPDAVVTIDDKAICFDGNPAALLFKIKNFKPWNKR